MCKPEEDIQLENSLNNDLCRLKKYFDVNRLSINVAKCVFMLIGTHQALQKMLDIRVHIYNETLKRVSVAKYIGMYIDENLKWNVHIDNIIPKISAKIGVLRSPRKIIPTATLKLLYNAIVLYQRGSWSSTYRSIGTLCVLYRVLCNLPDGLFVWEPGCWFLDCPQCLVDTGGNHHTPLMI